MNYCTLQEVKDELDITEVKYDGIITAMIDQAGVFIDKYCDRSSPPPLQLAISTAEGLSYLSDDLVSVSALELDEDADGVVDATMATTDYYLYPLNKYPKTRIEISNDSDYSGFASGVKSGVKVTGSWGFASTIPTTIKRACIIQTCRWFKRRETAFQDMSGSPEMGQFIAYKGLDPDIKLILEQYRKRGYP